MSVELQAPSLEEGFEKLRRAADSIPPERRPPEMRLLLASEQQFRSTVGLSRAALEAERAGLPLEHTLSQHQWLQLELAFLRACALGTEANGAFSAAASAQAALWLRYGLAARSGQQEVTAGGQRTTVPLLRVDFSRLPAPRPGASAAEQAIDALTVGALLLAGNPSEKAAGLRLLCGTIDSIWPPPNRRAAQARMQAQGWVPATPPASAGSSAVSAGAAAGAAAGEASTPLAEEVATLLMAVQPDLSVGELHRTALVLRCTARSMVFIAQRLGTGGDKQAAREAAREGLLDCQRLVDLSPGSMYAHIIAAQHLEYSQRWGDGEPLLAPVLHYLESGMELAAERRWSYAAMRLAYFWGVHVVDAVRRLANQPAHRQLAAEAMEHVRALMERCKPWEEELRARLPYRRLHVVAEPRKQLVQQAEAFLATGRIVEVGYNVVGTKERPRCSACGREAWHLRRCGGCKKELYCSEACQREHWRSGHREACRGAKRAGASQG